MTRQNNFFLPRSRAEQDPAFKQIIPYIVFTFEGTILRYVRGAKSGEKRLVDKASIGIGGHINDSDESLFSFDKDAYRAAVHREVAEELRFEGNVAGSTRGIDQRRFDRSRASPSWRLCMWSSCATTPFAPGRERSASSVFSRPKNSGNSETNSNHGRKLCWTPGKRCSVPTDERPFDECTFTTGAMATASLAHAPYRLGDFRPGLPDREREFPVLAFSDVFPSRCRTRVLPCHGWWRSADPRPELNGCHCVARRQGVSDEVQRVWPENKSPLYAKQDGSGPYRGHRDLSNAKRTVGQPRERPSRKVATSSGGNSV